MQWLLWGNLVVLILGISVGLGALVGAEWYQSLAIASFTLVSTTVMALCWLGLLLDGVWSK